MKIKIADLAQESGVKFGTSGARGLVEKMNDLVCYTYTRGFIQFLESINDIKKNGEEIAIAGDLRDSTDRIVNAVSKAILDVGYKVRFCGKIPTPTLLFYALSKGLSSIMVTGSHIPADRNGIKFNKVAGEVLKTDERGMLEQEVEVDKGLFDQIGNLIGERIALTSYETEALNLFNERYKNFFAKDFLLGKKIVVYQHSAVGRDMLVNILRMFGAEVITLARSDVFIPLDTEAIAVDRLEYFKTIAKENKPFAIVSTDGDSDRPLVCDENGDFVRGDILGIIVSQYLGADAIVTTASANGALEESKLRANITRTKIGSPYVVAHMIELSDRFSRVVGYESNGGFLLNSEIKESGRLLKSLPSRDSFLPILSILARACLKDEKISDLVKRLPRRFTHSQRLENIPSEKSLQFLKQTFEFGGIASAEELFGDLCGKVSRFEEIDGLRIIFENGEVIHIRPSGNAPELRIYTEAGSNERAKELCEKSLSKVESKISLL